VARISGKEVVRIFGTRIESGDSCEEVAQIGSSQIGKRYYLRHVDIHVLVVAGNLIAHRSSRVERKMRAEIASQYGLERVSGK
jgi:hypothetical protein